MSIGGEAGLTIKELVTKLGFDVDEKKLEGFERGLETAKVAAEALTLVWEGLVMGLFELTRETAEYGEEVQINSELLGISTERFQKLRYAAQAFGIENENIITSLRFFNKTMGDAEHGMGEGGIALQRLKIGMRELKDLPVDKQLSIIADRLHGVQSASERAAASTKLFGRAGAHFGQFLAQGSGAVNAMGEQLNGLLMTKEQVEAGQKTHAALIQVKALVTALRNEIGVRLFPVVQQIAKSVIDWVQANKKLIETRIDRFVHIVTEAVNFGWQAFKKIYEYVKDFISILGGLENALKLFGITMAAIFGARVIGSVLEMAKAFRELSIAELMAEADILVLPAAIAAVALALDDLHSWFVGEDSVLGSIVGPFKSMSKGMQEAINQFLGAFDGLGTAIWTQFTDGFTTAKDFITGQWGKWLKDLAKQADDLKLFSHLFGGISNALMSLIGLSPENFDKWMKSDSAMRTAYGQDQRDKFGQAGLRPDQKFGFSFDPNAFDNSPPAWRMGGRTDVGDAGTRGGTNVHVNIEMPPGSPQSQVDYVKQAASATFDLMFNRHLFQAMQAAPAGE